MAVLKYKDPADGLWKILAMGSITPGGPAGGVLTGTYPNPSMGAVTWFTPTFQNSWVDYGSGHRPTAYCLDALGFVHIRGLVKSGTAALIFTLPSGFRPAYTEIFVPESAAAAFGRIDVTSAGNVNVTYGTGGSNVNVSLAGITFQNDGS